MSPSDLSITTRLPAEEPKRYAAAVEALRRQWEADKASKPIGEATGATLAWIAIVKT